MGVKRGHKQTDIGAIPQDWSLESLGHAGRWLSGGTPSMANDAFWGGEIPWVSAKDMKTPRLRDSELHVTQSSIGNGTRVAPLGAILIVVRGMILAHTLPVAITERPMAFNQDIKALVPRDGIHGEFLTLWLQASSSLILTLCSEATHGTKRLPSDDLFAVRFPLPKRAEQHAIAQALGDADALLAGLDRLIAKKGDLKQGAMQQLLTGQTRLPGFRGGWQERRVDEVGEVLAGKALAANGVGPQRPYLRTKNVLDGCIDVDDVLEMPMTDAEFETFRIVPDDLLLNEGQSLGLVGRCSMYRDELRSPCAMQNQLLRFRARTGTCPRFTEQLFRHCQHNGTFASIATQTTSVAHLGSKRFGSLRLRWPSDPQEQVAIAEVLSDMDMELAALHARRGKTRALKQAMMQELLTGRTRLV